MRLSMRQERYLVVAYQRLRLTRRQSGRIGLCPRTDFALDAQYVLEQPYSLVRGIDIDLCLGSPLDRVQLHYEQLLAR